MESTQVWAFVAFSLVGSFTPGPNTTIATTTGANFGFRATVPHILGVPVGFSVMLALVSLGIAGILLSLPGAASAIKWIGIAYLLYLGWLLTRGPRPAPDGSPKAPGVRPLTFLQSALFQLANPKAWMLTVATAGTYMSGGGIASRVTLLCAIFAAACMVSLVTWAWVGAGLRAWLRAGRRLRWFNAAMGASLAATAVWMAVTT